jgi:hypothetical protein
LALLLADQLPQCHRGAGLSASPRRNCTNRLLAPTIVPLARDDTLNQRLQLPIVIMCRATMCIVPFRVQQRRQQEFLAI